MTEGYPKKRFSIRFGLQATAPRALFSGVGVHLLMADKKMLVLRWSFVFLRCEDCHQPER